MIGSENLDGFVYRATKVVPHSKLNQIESEPENVRILLDKDVKAYPIDMGALAFTKRASLPENSSDDRCLPVDEMTLVAGRRKFLLGIFDLLWRYKNHRTVKNICTKITQILWWCDENNYSLVFVDSAATSKAYRDYTDYLNHRIANGLIKPITASGLQRFFCRLSEVAFPEEHLHISNSAIAIKVVRREGRAPSEASVALYIKCCLAIARGISRAVIDAAPFPWVIGFDGFDAVLFPANGAIYTPFSGRESHSYNIEERRLATLDEFLLSIGRDGSVGRAAYYAQAVLNEAAENLSRANIDHRSEYRIRFATVAVKAYANLIIAITGCSPSELVQFDYDEALEVEKSLVKKELSAVKLRARGRKTRYALGKEGGLIILREFIELRNWLLQGESFEKLFFRFEMSGNKPSGVIRSLSRGVTYNFYQHITGLYLDPSVPHLGSRLLRRHKSVVLHSMGFAPQVVADVLNHSLSTNLADYTGTMPEQQDREMGLFWKSIRKASSKVRDRKAEQSISIAAGHCDGFDSPKPIDAEIEIAPDCKTQFGCLYCEQYVCHADEEDAHKLLSLQYVVEAVRRASPDSEHSEYLFKKLSVRLQYILREISDRSNSCSEMISRMTKRVHELGDITPFWENRLQRYEKLGVAF